MRIGIVTFTFWTNYGCLLQAYALQTALRRMGHEVEHLQLPVEFPTLHPSWKMPMVYCKRVARKFFCGERSIPIFMHPHKWIRINTDAFIASHICPRYLNEEEWTGELSNEYDAIIFGSDQIWRPIYAYPIEKYFGAFLGETRKVRIHNHSSGIYSTKMTREWWVWQRRFPNCSARK